MQSIVDFLYMVDDMLWGTPMVVIVLGTGIFLSLGLASAISGS